MYISGIKKDKARRGVIAYSCVTMFCCLFSAVYEHFSHGVFSGYMVYLFLFPLLCGVLPALLFALIPKARFPGRISMNLYNSGVAALAVGSCIRGILEIYGTSSDFVLVYWTVGIVCALSGIAAYLVEPSGG